MENLIRVLGKVEAKNPPAGAQYCTLSPDKSFIELYYRIKDVKFNDGTKGQALEYRSSFDVWMGSGQNKPIEVYEIS